MLAVRDCYGLEAKCFNGYNIDDPSRMFCYRSYDQCDNTPHCSDRSDESSCYEVCKSDETRCAAG